MMANHDGKCSPEVAIDERGPSSAGQGHERDDHGGAHDEADDRSDGQSSRKSIEVAHAVIISKPCAYTARAKSGHQGGQSVAKRIHP